MYVCLYVCRHVCMYIKLMEVSRFKIGIIIFILFFFYIFDQ